MLLKHTIQLAIFHWYTGPVSIIKSIIDGGYYFSINPAMIRSEKGRKIIASIPKEKVLTETDGPFVQIGSKLAEPADVETVVNYLAASWKIDFQSAALQVQSNFTRLISALKTN